MFLLELYFFKSFKVETELIIKNSLSSSKEVFWLIVVFILLTLCLLLSLVASILPDPFRDISSEFDALFITSAQTVFYKFSKAFYSLDDLAPLYR